MGASWRLLLACCLCACVTSVVCEEGVEPAGDDPARLAIILVIVCVMAVVVMVILCKFACVNYCQPAGYKKVGDEDDTMLEVKVDPPLTPPATPREVDVDSAVESDCEVKQHIPDSDSRDTPEPDEEPDVEAPPPAPVTSSPVLATIVPPRYSKVAELPLYSADEGPLAEDCGSHIEPLVPLPDSEIKEDVHEPESHIDDPQLDGEAPVMASSREEPEELASPATDDELAPELGDDSHSTGDSPEISNGSPPPPYAEAHSRADSLDPLSEADVDEEYPSETHPVAEVVSSPERQEDHSDNSLDEAVHNAATLHRPHVLSMDQPDGAVPDTIHEPEVEEDVLVEPEPVPEDSSNVAESEPLYENLAPKIADECVESAETDEIEEPKNDEQPAMENAETEVIHPVESSEVVADIHADNVELEDSDDNEDAEISNESVNHNDSNDTLDSVHSIESLEPQDSENIIDTNESVEPTPAVETVEEIDEPIIPKEEQDAVEEVEPIYANLAPRKSNEIIDPVDLDDGSEITTADLDPSLADTEDANESTEPAVDPIAVAESVKEEDHAEPDSIESEVVETSNANESSEILDQEVVTDEPVIESSDKDSPAATPVPIETVAPVDETTEIVPTEDTPIEDATMDISTEVPPEDVVPTEAVAPNETVSADVTPTEINPSEDTPEELAPTEAAPTEPAPTEPVSEPADPSLEASPAAPEPPVVVPDDVQAGDSTEPELDCLSADEHSPPSSVVPLDPVVRIETTDDDLDDSFDMDDYQPLPTAVSPRKSALKNNTNTI